ncbi:probable galactinol--sucrose galactosyltransferase 2, partial [Primulina huaijiensis]
FNCQGAGWCKTAKKTRIHDASPGTLTSSVQVTDVDTLSQIAGSDWNGVAIVYAHKSGEIILLPKGASLPVTLKALEYELFHFCPVKIIATDVSFAPIGLLGMFNSGGAVEQFDFHKAPECDSPAAATVTLKVRGSGLFGVYCSQRPQKCIMDGMDAEFNYKAETGLVTLIIPVPEEEMYRWTIEVQV